MYEFYRTTKVPNSLFRVEGFILKVPGQLIWNHVYVEVGVRGTEENRPKGKKKSLRLTNTEGNIR